MPFDLASLGPTAAAVVIVALFLKYMTDQSKQQRELYVELKGSIDKNTQTTDETLTFMRNLNGKLERALIDKATIMQAGIRNASFGNIQEQKKGSDG